MRTSTFKSLAAIGALALLAACSDTTSPYSTAVGGTYSLNTVNGTNLPYTYTSGNSTITIQNDIYTLNGDGTYSEAINETVSNGGGGYSPASDAEAGTWYQNGNAVTFSPNYSTQNSYAQYTGSLQTGSTFSHSSITFSYNGVVWVYNHS